MNLICPHCQKLVTIGDQLAGQTTNCPQCQGPFTVPLPPRPASAAPPATPSPLPLAPLPGPENTPTTAFSPELEATPPPAPPPPPGDYRRRIGFSLQPRILRWIAPTCFVLIFILMFFPWVGIYHGSYKVARQVGFGVAFGVYDGPQGKDSLTVEERPGVSPFTLLYFLFLMIALVASVGLVVLTFAPQVVPPHIRQLVTPWRTLAMGGLALLTLVLLVPQVLMRLPLESRILETAEREYDKGLAAAKEAKETAQATAKAQVEMKYGIVENAVQRRTAFRLVVLLNLIAVLGALADLWLEKRPGLPPPRVMAEW